MKPLSCLYAVTLSFASVGVAMADAEECVSYESGFPSIASVQHRIARANDPRFSLDPDRPVERPPELQRSIESFDEWLNTYLRVVEAHLLNNQEAFAKGLRTLEESFVGDDRNSTHRRSMALFLVKLYADAQPPMTDRGRLSAFELALDLLQSSGGFDLDVSQKLTVTKAQARLGYITGNVGQVKAAAESASNVASSLPAPNDPNNQAETYKRLLAEAMGTHATLKQAYANVLLGEMTGQVAYFEKAITMLEGVTPRVGAGCSSELAGEKSYYLAYAFLQLARDTEDPYKARDLLAKALDHAGAARKALELLYYPSRWRRAHELSADIYQELEIHAKTQSERQDFRRLKERAFLLSKTR